MTETISTDAPKATPFETGELQTSDFFTTNFSGPVYLKMLTDNPAAPIANVTFAPGTLNSWHVHKGGQVLLVTHGRGWYCEWEGAARELKPGDVGDIPAGVKHWHGAAKDSWFAHISIEIDPEKGPAEWLEPVAKEDYAKLP